MKTWAFRMAVTAMVLSVLGVGIGTMSLIARTGDATHAQSTPVAVSTPTANCTWATDQAEKFMDALRRQIVTPGLGSEDATNHAIHLYELRDKACF